MSDRIKDQLVVSSGMRTRCSITEQGLAQELRFNIMYINTSVDLTLPEARPGSAPVHRQDDDIVDHEYTERTRTSTATVTDIAQYIYVVTYGNS